MQGGSAGPDRPEAGTQHRTCGAPAEPQRGRGGPSHLVLSVRSRSWRSKETIKTEMHLYAKHGLQTKAYSLKD